MSVKPWKTLASRYLFKRNGLAVRLDRVETRHGEAFEPYVFEYGTWVNVIALTPEKQVVLIEQYRHGVGAVMLELPAGMMDERDAGPEAAARRELLEETGYAGARFIEVGRVYPNPATHTNMTCSFLALDVEKVAEQNLEETEDIEVQLLPWDEFVALVKDGGMPQALHISALFYALNYLEHNPLDGGIE
jgi:8-oxo-dGTP pyrophosphatase MutT (NUDIX family)